MKTRLATAAVAGVLSLAVTGAAAFAAFQPPATTAMVAATDTGVTASTHAEKDADGLRAVLARLVQNGTITQAQADAILAALKTAAEDKEDKKDRKKDTDRAREAAAVLKRILANMLKLSVEHIGLPQEAVTGQLKAGKSLGEIADGQPGKSRDGLIAYLVEKLTAQLDQAVADGKITKERADEAKAHLRERVVRFVDHKYERKPSPPKERKPIEKKPAPSPTAKPTT